MKKTQIKDALRNIRKRWVTFLSVIIIAGLGTSIFLSIGFARKAIARNATEVYDSMRFRNIEIVSTLLISPDDLEAVRALDGAADAELVWQAGAAVYYDGGRENAYIISLGSRINVPELLEGRLPESLGECLLEKDLAEKLGLRVGDSLMEVEMTDDAGQYVLTSEFRVTGIAMHPDHISRTIRETNYIIVPRETFDLETLQGAGMKAEVVMEDAEGEDRFSAPHERKAASLTEEIERLAPERTPLTDAAVKKAAHAQVDVIEESWQEELDRIRRESPDDTESIESWERNIRDLEENHREIENMAPTRWIVLDEHSNAGFEQADSCIGTLTRLQMNFGLMFIAIGALTILSTIGKMVSEQRTQVGTVKAMGLYNREIIQKYLLFGVSAVIAGAVAGSLAGRFLLEGIVLENYSASFAADLSAPAFDWITTIAVTAAWAALAAVSVWIACRSLMKESANALMQPPVPKGIGKARRDRKSLLGLYSRLIFRNARSDWKRVTVTIISVFGCCAMVGVGFTLKNAVNSCPAKQDSEIAAYDGTLRLRSPFGDSLREILEEAGAERVEFLSAGVVIRAKESHIAQLMCGDIAEIGSMYRLLDWKTGEPLPPSDEGVYIHQRLAETAGLRVGSEIRMSAGLTESAPVRVIGIFRNYLGMPVVMSSACYESLYSKVPMPDTFFVRMNGADRDSLVAALKEDFEFESWTDSGSAERVAFEAAMGSIDSVDTLLIAIAAIMTGVVQMNLTSTYIQQKKRELILMRINGFTNRELVGYLLRETVFTTGIGILAGIAGGCGIGYYIVRSVEMPYMQFDRSFFAPAWLYAAGITVLFTVAVNAVALQRVRKLKLTDLE